MKRGLKDDIATKGKKRNSLRSRRPSRPYTTALEYSAESCHKLYVHEIDRHHLLNFSTLLREEKKQSARSFYNKFETVRTFLKANSLPGLVRKNDWPRYTEAEPEMYEPEDLDKLCKACKEEVRLWFEFFLMTGMREREVMHTYWSDINFPASSVRVTHKPDRNWTPKAYQEREIPIPIKLVKKLKTRKAKSDRTCGAVFPTAGCNPKLDFPCDSALAERDLGQAINIVNGTRLGIRGTWSSRGSEVEATGGIDPRPSSIQTNSCSASLIPSLLITP